MTDGKELIPVGGTDLELLDASVADYVLSAISDNTKRAYRSDLRAFQHWGGSVPASDRMIARYLADNATKLAIATLARRIVSIGKAHHAGSAFTDEFSEREPDDERHSPEAWRASAKGGGATKEIVLAMVTGLGDDVHAQHDRALLLIGFAGAFRRSELVAINCNDISRVPEGLFITLRHGKTDQESEGREIRIPAAKGPVSPVRMLEESLEAAGIIVDPVFLIPWRLRVDGATSRAAQCRPCAPLFDDAAEGAQIVISQSMR